MKRTFGLLFMLLLSVLLSGCGGSDNASPIKESPEVSGVAVKESISFDGGYVQFRSIENYSDFYRGWLGFTENGNPVNEEDISRITLKTSDGIAIPITTFFYTESSYSASWNDETQDFHFYKLFTDSAFSIRLADGVSLDSGTYTYEATTSNGGVLSLDREFPGETVMPYVEASSIGSAWQADGSLFVTWTNPEGAFDQLRLVLYDQSWNTLLYLKLPSSVKEMTIPAEWISDMTALRNPQSAKIEIQTRNYTSDGNNYARGCSDTVNISWGTNQIYIDYGYLQYRSYENSANNAIRGCLEFLNSGNPVNESDITGIVLRSGDGSSVPLTSVFYTDNYIVGLWNEATLSVELDTITSSFVMFRFPETAALDAGNYSYEVSTTDGETLTLELNYPGEVIIPYVKASSINYEWLADGSLRTNWINPANSYYEMRFVLLDQNWNTLLYVTLPSSSEEFVLPAEWVNYISTHMNPINVRIQVQTRSYAGWHNFARGYSDTVLMPWDG